LILDLNFLLVNAHRTRAISDSDIKSSEQGLTSREKGGKDGKTLTSSGSSSSLTNLIKEATNPQTSKHAQRPSFSLTEGIRSVVGGGVRQSNSGGSLTDNHNYANPNNVSPSSASKDPSSKPFWALFGGGSRSSSNNQIAGSPAIPSRRGSTNAIPSRPTMPTAFQPQRPESVKLNDKKGSLKGSMNQPIVFVQKPEASKSSTPSLPYDDNEFEFDTVYNLIDNYSALICCSMLHVELIQTLFVLGTEGQRPIAVKSRKLLVIFLKILSNVLPENLCSSLLTSPSLIEIASSARYSTVSPSKTYKASLILLEIANTFSIMPIPQNYSTINNFTLDGVGLGGPHSTIQNQSSVSQLNFSAANARNRAGSTNVRGSAYVVNPTSTRSNLPSLNIQNLFLLMEEVKVCSRVTNPNDMDVDSSSGLTTSIRSSLIPVVDKMEFTRQIELSRVNQGKEPFKWDWIIISEMFEHAFTSSDRLSEALKTKFLKRISGFFRCSSDEKGYFANLDWEPNNLQYLECACNLYSVLLKDDVGMQFLTSDRRGLIFTEISHEIELLTNYASNKYYQQQYAKENAVGSSSSVNSIGPKMVFRMHSCNYSIAREFFTLLGRILRDSKSRKLLDQANIFNHLTVLGQYPSLDYISRLVITSLALTDGGNISRHLYQFWTADETAGSCSKLLKEYLYSLLRVLIRCHQNHNHEVYLWCVETIVSQLSIDDDSTNNCLSNDSLFILYKAMTECIHSKTCVKVILEKRPRFILNHYNQILQVVSPANATSVPVSTANTSENQSDNNSPMYGSSRKRKPSGMNATSMDVNLEREQMLHNILIRLLGITEGLQFLMEKNYFDVLVNSWLSRKCKEYVETVEDNINDSLFQIINNNSIRPSQTLSVSDMLSVVQAIPIRIPDIALANASDYDLNQKSSGGIDHTIKQYNPNGHLDLDFHGLFRIPWNIETKVVNHGLNIGDAAINNGEYLRVDAFLGQFLHFNFFSFIISTFFRYFGGSFPTCL
jgi:hypothetical protein